jgi:hypothetical protein
LRSGASLTPVAKYPINSLFLTHAYGTFPYLCPPPRAFRARGMRAHACRCKVKPDTTKWNSTWNSIVTDLQSQDKH